METTGWEMFAPDLIPGVLTFFFGMAIPVAIIVGILLRRAYRKAVSAAMRANLSIPDGPPLLSPAATNPNGGTLEITTGNLPRDQILRPWIGLRHLAAGLAYTGVLTVITYITAGEGMDLYRGGLVFLGFLPLPAALGMAAVGIRLRWNALIILLWCGTLHVWLPDAWLFLLGLLGVPMVILVMLANPFLRTTAVPVYLGSVLMLLPALFTLPISSVLSEMWFPLLEILPPPLVVIIQVLTVLFLLTAFGALLVKACAPWIGRVLGSSSELMMLSDATYLITTLWIISLYWTDIGANALSVGLAFAAYRLTLRLLRPGPSDNAPVLLLLRVFGHRASQQKLARGLLRDWRRQGPVVLIGGEDLATETLDSDELAAFLTGGLGHLFLNDAADLNRAMSEQSTPYIDGLYPTHDYYCRSHSWKPAVETLMSRAALVILDLRGLSPENAGVRFEIDALAARVPVAQIQVLYDDSTDMDLARSYFDDAFKTHGTARGGSKLCFLKAN